MLGQAGKVPAISERDEAHRRPIRQEQEGAALRPVRQEQHENHFAVPHGHCTALRQPLQVRVQAIMSVNTCIGRMGRMGDISRGCFAAGDISRGCLALGITSGFFEHELSMRA